MPVTPRTCHGPARAAAGGVGATSTPTAAASTGVAELRAAGAGARGGGGGGGITPPPSGGGAAAATATSSTADARACVAAHHPGCSESLERRSLATSWSSSGFGVDKSQSISQRVTAWCAAQGFWSLAPAVAKHEVGRAADRGQQRWQRRQCRLAPCTWPPISPRTIQIVAPRRLRSAASACRCRVPLGSTGHRRCRRASAIVAISGPRARSPPTGPTATATAAPGVKPWLA